VAVTVLVLPTFKKRDEGVIVKTGVGVVPLVTVTVQVAVLPLLSAAMICVVPTLTAVTVAVVPLPATVATVVFWDRHTSAPTLFPAWIVAVFPTSRGSVEGVITRFPSLG
jgi:hypothetical protein